MQTIGEKFMRRLKGSLSNRYGGALEMIRADGSTDLLGRCDVVVQAFLSKSVLQFTYHFGPHSWHPIIVHHSPEMNESIQVFRWNDIDRAFDAILAGVEERLPLVT